MGKWINRYKQDADLWQDDDYKAMFDKATSAINEWYTADMHCYIKENLPDIARQIDESESRLDQLWGEAPLDEYRKELVKFYKLHERVYIKYSMAS